MKAQDFLKAGLGHMQDRAATYDKPNGERSMDATVNAFIAVTGDGKMDTEERGWLFMGLLKMVRSQQGAFKADNYEDEAAYSGLRGECAFAARATVKESLTVEADPDGWIKWDGGECPVSDLERVQTIERRESKSNFNRLVQDANDVLWEHRYGENDVVAYRINKAGE